MTITPQLFAAFLKCPTKCWLRFAGEPRAGNDYAEWVIAQTNSYQVAAADYLTADVPANERNITPAAGDLKNAKWELAVNVTVQTAIRSSCRRADPHFSARSFKTSDAQLNEQSLPSSSATFVETSIHAIQRLPSGGRGKPAQFVPIRFIFTNKLDKDDKLLLAFDAVVLTKAFGRDVRLGKIIHGDDRATLKVKTLVLAGEVRKRIERIAALLSSAVPPDLVLNRHCSECEFQARCRGIAVERDDLSLLSSMSAKERQKLRSKGIFTVTQLSFTFRPRRRLRRLRDKRERYHHSLKALAIREKKIHLVGSPDLKIEGTPIYLDVEGLPDRDFYYLIGLRIGDGESAIQHSLWADSFEDERKIWREFLGILEKTDKPVLIHYGSYETTFLGEMRARHGGPLEGSVAEKAIGSALNLVSVIFAKIYFPTFSNGLKDIARFLGFDWSSDSASGIQSIALREAWTNRKTAARHLLIRYNKEDCEALGLVTSEVMRLRQVCFDTRSSGERSVVDATALKREHPYGFKRNAFFFPELDAINKAAYWDYQREKVYVKSNVTVRRALKKAKRKTETLTPNKHIRCAAPLGCPTCGSRYIRKHGREKKTVHDIKFNRSGLKRWIIQYHFHRYYVSVADTRFIHQRGRGLAPSSARPLWPTRFTKTSNCDFRRRQSTRA